MQIDLYQVDAFTNKVFGGNPAAVCPLKEWLPDDILQKIAMENNLSETAFFIPSTQDNVDFDIRFLTPTMEIDLCGHATLASAFTLFNHLNISKETIRLSSHAGILTVTKSKTGYTLNFPVWSAEAEKYTAQQIEDVLGVKVLETHQSAKIFAILENEDAVKNYKPDISKINALTDVMGIVITAKSNEDDIDFTSRLFAPQIGIDEDPVTGAIHCFLTPFWAKRLNKTSLNAYQASARGGELFCELKNDRVEITGNAVLYMQGKINV